MSSPHNSHGSIVVQLLNCVQLLVAPWTVACQAPLPMGFPRQGYWSGLPFSFPRDLSDQGNPNLLHWQADSLPLSHQGSPSHGSPGAIIIFILQMRKMALREIGWLAQSQSASHGRKDCKVRSSGSVAYVLTVQSAWHVVSKVEMFVIYQNYSLLG